MSRREEQEKKKRERVLECLYCVALKQHKIAI